jgi:hypothetical protein
MTMLIELLPVAIALTWVCIIAVCFFPRQK